MVEFDPGAGLLRRAARPSSGARTTRRQLNRQGPDVGGQYRSAIFFHSPEQEEKAVASKARVQAPAAGARIVTEIVPAETFYAAEDYHQQYFEKQGRTSCHVGLRSATAAR